ncbi:MAG: chemotaxis protein CheA [Bacteroidales bacterium]|nr:chemotaxis protein CheA [Bacteroidales bacterium]
MMNEFVNSFIDEARELLYQLESDLLLLEKTPGDRKITDNIFRVMHNLKGAARMYGFENMQYVAHEFESIFDQIRAGKISVSKELIDDTLKARDILMSMLDKNPSTALNQDFLKQLSDKYAESQNITAAGPVEVISGKPSDQRLFCILFTPDKQVFERGLNPDKVIDEIQASGKTKIIAHENETPWEAQKSMKFCQTAWEIYLFTSLTINEMGEVFLFYDDDEYCINEIKEDSANDPSMLVFFQQHYNSEASLTDHLLECTRDLKEDADISAGANTPGVNPNEESGGKSFNHSKPGKDGTINVSSQKLDELLNLVSELVISTAALDAHAIRLKDLQLNNLIENVEKLTKRFRINALDLRLIPVGTLLNRFNRQVRDLSEDLGKKVLLVLEGQETEIDKSVLRSIESPLMHIIRNSIDHGIESPQERLQKGKTDKGILKIAAFYSGANVIIQIHDDGRGINLEKIRERAILKGYITPDQSVTDQELLNLIMEPGFTTSENVSIVSGRGVGMDVVRKELNAIGGSLIIETEKDLGTSITMKLPTTLSIIDTLMLKVNDSHVLIPLLEVEYCYMESRNNLYLKNSNYLQYKNNMVPFISLRQKFNFPLHNNPEEMVIILNKFNTRYAIVVDDIIGEQQAVIKPLGELFINQPYFSGGSILVDGNLALVLDTNYLFNQSVLN